MWQQDEFVVGNKYWRTIMNDVFFCAMINAQFFKPYVFFLTQHQCFSRDVKNTNRNFTCACNDNAKTFYLTMF